MKKGLLVILTLVMAFSLVVAGCGGKKEEPKKDAAPKKISIKMSVTTPADSSPWNIAAKKFAEIVKEKTKGRSKLQPSPMSNFPAATSRKASNRLLPA